MTHPSNCRFELESILRHLEPSLDFFCPDAGRNARSFPHCYDFVEDLAVDEVKAESFPMNQSVEYPDRKVMMKSVAV